MGRKQKWNDKYRLLSVALAIYALILAAMNSASETEQKQAELTFPAPAANSSDNKIANKPLEAIQLLNSSQAPIETPAKPPDAGTMPPLQKSAASIPVLYYHSVAEKSDDPIVMPLKQFEEQIKYLADQEYKVLNEDEFYDCLFEKAGFPEKSVFMTFDDGYDGTFTHAFSVMQKHGFVGIVFMISSHIDGKGYLTADQLKELRSAGWSIGGHTENHVDLAMVNSETAAREIKNADRALQDLLHQPVNAFAYPYGNYNSGIAALTKTCGYRVAFTTQKGWVKIGKDPYTLPRVYCYANMGLPEFIRRVTHPDY